MQLNSYLDENDLHEPLQSAYKIFHSIETALLTVTNDIMLSLDKGENVFLVLLDLVLLTYLFTKFSDNGSYCFYRFVYIALVLIFSLFLSL